MNRIGEQADARPLDGGPETDTADFPVFSEEESERLRRRWKDAQSEFVDDPHGSVSEVDALLDEAVSTLTRRLAERRDALRHGWRGADEPATEDLRVAMRRYRALFDHMVRS